MTTDNTPSESPYISEIERLTRENAELRRENDLLKKWQRYLADLHQTAMTSFDDGNRQA